MTIIHILIHQTMSWPHSSQLYLFFQQTIGEYNFIIEYSDSKENLYMAIIIIFQRIFKWI